MHGPPAAEDTHQIEALIEALEELRRRVAALEQWSATVAVEAAATPQSAPVSVTAPGLVEVSPGILAALGRLLLGIAGAYLLRAITEAGVVPQFAGTVFGLLYAAGWLISTLRIPAGDRLSVVIHGITAACIVAPLLFEATVRVHTCPATASASVLALFMILGQVCAWHRDHPTLAGVSAFAGAATSIALMIATLDPVPFAVALAAAAVAVEFGAWRDRALGSRWITALACDSSALLLLYLVTRPQGLPEGYAPVPTPIVGAILVALVAIYAANISVRTLARETRITWLELLQMAAIGALALGGGQRISQGYHAILLGIVCLIFGAACYAATFSGLVAGRNFHAYATFAILLMLAGGVVMPSSGEWLWLIVALALSALPGTTLSMHAAAYLFATAASSGLLVNPIAASGSPAIRELAAAAVSYALVLRARPHKTPEPAARVAAAAIAALICWSLMAFATELMLQARFAPSPASTLRTVLIAVVAVALAWLGSRNDLRELIWVLFPWMIFGAIKLATEEFEQGRPVNLALSLLIYGGTLIALPRLLRRSANT